MFLSNEKEQNRNRGFVKILKWCLLIVGLALILFILTGMENAEGATSVPGGPVNDLLYPGGWDNASAPYYIEGDIWVPNDNSLPGITDTLTIDGSLGPVDIYFNGDFSLKVGVPFSGIPARLSVTGNNNNIRFTRNGTLIMWDGIEFTNSANSLSIIDNAIIEYVSGGNDCAILLNGTTGVTIINNEIRYVNGTLAAVGIGLFDITDSRTTDNNDIAGNIIHNITFSVPLPTGSSGIALRSANSNQINDNRIENILVLGPGQATGIFLMNSSLNTIDPNIIDNIQSSLGSSMGIELYRDCDDNQILFNQISQIQAQTLGFGDARGIFIHTDSALLPDNNTVEGNTIVDVASGNSVAYGISVLDGGNTNVISQNDISDISCSQSGAGAYGMDIYYAPTTIVEFNEISYVTDNSEAFGYGLSYGFSDFGYVANNTIYMIYSNGTAIGLFKDVTVNTTFYNITIENVTGNSTSTVYSAVGLYTHWSSNNTFEDIKIRNITGLLDNASGLVLEGTTNEMFTYLTISGVYTFGGNAFGIYILGDAFSTFNNVLVEDIIAQNAAAAGIVTWGNTNEIFDTVTIQVIRGNDAFGFDLAATVQIEIVSLDLTGVTGDLGNATGIRQTIDCMDTQILNSSIADISTETQNASAFGIYDEDTYYDLIINLEINGITSSNGSAFGIWLNNTKEANIMDSIITNIIGDGNMTAGIHTISSTADCNITNINILSITNSEDAMGIYLGNETNNTNIDKNTIYQISSTGGTVYGIFITGETVTIVGNNSIYNIENGIYMDTGSYVIFYNNEIFDNLNWGLWMDSTSSGLWIVDDFGSLINNPAMFNGTIQVVSGKLTFFNVSSSSVGSVIIQGSGIMELGASPTTLISQNVWVEGLLYLNSSKWEINVSSNGQYGIQVNATGTMIIQDNGTGPSVITDGPLDNDGGTVGFDDFRYYFIVLSGATFQLTDSEISEAGWNGGITQRSLYIATTNAIISNTKLTAGYYGITISGGGWTFYDNEIENVDLNGMWIEGTIGVVVENSTINASASNGYGIMISGQNHVIVNCSVNTLGDSGHGIYLSGASQIDVINNMISTSANLARGFTFSASDFNLIRENNVSTLGINAHGMYLSSSSNNTIENNDIQVVSNSLGFWLMSSSNDNTIANSTISCLSTGIYIGGSNDNDIINNELSNFVRGIHIYSNSLGTFITDNNITQNSDTGIYIEDFSDGTIIQNNIIDSNTQYGIYIITSQDIDIINNDIFQNGIGIEATSSSMITLYNNDIYDNTNWGLWMDPSSSGAWIVDGPCSFLRNDGLLNGPLTVGTNGDMYIEQAFLQLHDVTVSGGGMLTVVDSKNTIVTWNVSISGTTILDNSSWEMNCTYDGEYKIEITPSGNLQVINDSLITAYDTSFRYDFWVNGTATFTDSTIEYAGYSYSAGSWGVQVTSDSVLFDNMVFNYCQIGIFVNGSQPTINNIESYNCTVAIALINGDTISITNVTVRDVVVPPGVGAAGIYVENYTAVSLFDIDIMSPNPDASGIMFINSTDGYVENAYILNMTNGMSINNSQVFVLNSDMIGNEDGIIATEGSIVNIQDCYIFDNSNIGVIFEDSGGVVDNCTISENQFIGIMADNSSPIVDSCIISGPNQNIGIESINGASPFVVNSSISSLITDFMTQSNSHPVALNCTFNNATTMFTDALSTLTVQWFLHIRVENLSGVAIPGVNVRVEDNANGTFDSSYITDGAGYVSWIIITEYIENSTEWLYYSPYTLSAYNSTLYGVRIKTVYESMVVVITLDMQAEIKIGKIADNTTVMVGDLITYTVWYDYSGLLDLTNVYLNDTFDLNLEYVSDTSSIIPIYILNSYSWFLGNVTPGNHSFDVVVRVMGGTTNGTMVSNEFDLQYSDFNYIPQAPATSNSVSSTILAAEITLEKSVENSTLDLGDFNTYTIWYNNTGGATASVLWVNDTFHTNLTIISDSAAANWTGSGWLFFNVTPGSHMITVVLQLDSWDGLYGQPIPNLATSDFFDYDGFKKPQVQSNFANFSVIIPSDVDYIRIEYFDGTLVTDGTLLTADDEIVLYARAYNFTTGFVDNVTVTWSVNGGIGILNDTLGTSITFNATTVGMGNISVDIPGQFYNVTGTITITPGSVVDVKIIPPGPETYSADDTIIYQALGYDSDGNLNMTWTPLWGWLGAGLGDMTIFTPDEYNYSIEFNVTGMDGVRVSVQGEPSIFNNSMVTVISGKVVNIELIPGGPETNSTDDVLNFTVFGYDANGNLNTSWTPNVSWFGPNLGIITVNGFEVTIEFTTNGTSTLIISDLADPSIFNSTKGVTVNLGAPYQIIYVSGRDQVGLPLASLASSFVVRVEDADGNPIPGIEIAWVIDGWPLGATGYSLSNPTSITDLNGEAQSILTLGDLPGIYYVNATNTTLTLVGEPVSFNASALSFTVDDILIGDQFGDPILDTSFSADDTITFYAWAYNNSAGVIGPIAVNWSSLGGIGTFTTSTTLQSQVTFDLTFVGTGNISIEFINATLNLNNVTGTITVFPGSVVSIEILPWPSTSATTDDVGAFSVVGKDADNNENWSWIPSWNWVGSELGLLTPIDPYNYTVDYNKTGMDTINVNVLGDLSTFTSTQVTVTIGQVARIEISPSSSSATTDNTGSFSIIGYDADDNENWIWTPQWSWEGLGLGILNQIDDYNYTVAYDTIGQDTINVSVLGIPGIYNLTDITIGVGQVVKIEITPWSSVDNNTGDSMNFSVIGYDADNFVNWSWIPSWAWEGAGLGSLTQITFYNYSVTFTSPGSDVVNVSSSLNPAIYNSTSINITDIITQPTIDYIVIMDAAGGLGNIITTKTFGVGETFTLYAAGFNATTGTYVADIDVLWSIDNEIVGTVTPGSGSSTILLTNLTNYGDLIITATNTSLQETTNSTGTITVIEPNIDYIQIRDAASGLGNLITSINLTSGTITQYHAAGYNATTGLFVSDVSVIWDVSVSIGSISPAIGYSTNLTTINVNGVNVQGTLQAVYNVIENQTSVLVNLPPSTPQNLEMNQVPEGGTLILTWTQNTESDVVGYMIYRTVTSGFGYINVGTVEGVASTSFTDTNLADGTTYYYYIVAYDDGPNYSPNSAEVGGTSDKDSDGDGEFDLIDLDDDNDGLLDTEELIEGEDGYITDPLNPDSDGDGHDDAEDFYPLDEAKWEKGETVEPEDFPWLILVILLVVVVVLILFFVLAKRKKPQEDIFLEEVDETKGVTISDEAEPEEELVYEEEYEEAPEEEYEEAAEGEDVEDDLEYECPECGYPVPGNISKCPSCGTEFEVEEGFEEEE